MYSSIFILIFIGSLCRIDCRDDEENVYEVSLVLNGVPSKENIQATRCSLLSAIQRIIDRNSYPYSSILSKPKHWTIYHNNVKVSTKRCKKGNDDPLDLKADDYVYVFFNENAFNDLSYAADYLKYISKLFNQHVKSGKIKYGTKNNDSGNNDISKLFGMLLSSGYVNDFVKGLLSSKGKDAISNIFSELLAPPNKNDAKKSDHANKNHADQLKGLLTTYAQPLLEGVLGSLKTDTDKNTEL